MRNSRLTSQFGRISMEEWRRPLGPTAYARGISTCIENARALLDDAQFLLEEGRAPRAVALAILAVEEGDKLKRIFRLAFGSDPAWVEEQWKAFRDHKAKLPSALSLLTHGGYSLWDRPSKRVLPVLWDNPDLPRLAQRLKERCLYVTRLRDGTWSVPARVAPPLLASAIVSGARWVFSVSSVLALSGDMLIGGQFEESPGFERPDLSDASPRAKRWLKWRLGPAGQRWGRRELARHLKWMDRAAESKPAFSGRRASRPARAR